MENNKTKICTKCHKEKDFTNDFFMRNRSKGSKQSECKQCNKDRKKTQKAKDYKKDPTTTKYCDQCKTTKSTNEFFGNKQNTDGCQSYCKKCEKERRSKYESNYDYYMVTLFSILKYGAKDRDIDVNIIIDDLHDLYKQQDGKCKLTGIELTHIRGQPDKTIDRYNAYNISVDRIDSDKAYTKNNIQLVCCIVNLMKRNYSEKDFIENCILITKLRHSKQ